MTLHGRRKALLRPSSIADLDPIHALETAIFGRDAWSRAAMSTELTSLDRCYVTLIEPDGEIRGYAGMLVLGEVADIQTIAIDPELRGHGYGRELMEALIAEALELGVREIFLEVRADNPVAHRLYVKLGFEQLRVRRGYYQPDGVDAIVMRLDTAKASLITPSGIVNESYPAPIPGPGYGRTLSTENEEGSRA